MSCNSNGVVCSEATNPLCNSVVYISLERFYGTNCDEYHFFICHETKVVGFEYTFVPQLKTWSEARDYCRNNFDDLATFEWDLQMNEAVSDWDYPVWTGLYRDGKERQTYIVRLSLFIIFSPMYGLGPCDLSSNICSAGGTFKWSSGVSKYFDWASGEPGNNGDCVSILSHQKKMAIQDCSAHFPFVCLRDNLVLVKENKTWEEALEHCRGLDPSNPRYELLSIQPEVDHMYVVTTVVQGAVTEKVGVYV